MPGEGKERTKRLKRKERELVARKGRGSAKKVGRLGGKTRPGREGDFFVLKGVHFSERDKKKSWGENAGRNTRGGGRENFRGGTKKGRM